MERCLTLTGSARPLSCSVSVILVAKEIPGNLVRRADLQALASVPETLGQNST